MTTPSPARQAAEEAAIAWVEAGPEPRNWDSYFDLKHAHMAGFEAGYALAIEQSAKEDAFINVIREWKWHWRTEQPGYEDRPAHQPDANMAHDLARRLCDSIRALMPESCAKMEDGK